MDKLIGWLFSRKHKLPEENYPASMQDLQPKDSCWCGSGKAYKKCHRPEDRRREKELGLNRKGKSLCDAFT